MSNLNEMWAELERYQPYADKHGFGGAWRRMTTERTEAAAWDAERGAAAAERDAACDVAWAAAWAATAVRSATDASEASKASAESAESAITRIRKPIELEQEKKT